MANETEYNQPQRTSIELGGTQQFEDLIQSQGGNQFEEKDWRARIRPKKGGEKWAYGLVDPDDPTKEVTDSVLKPLQERGGIVFPYTPDIFYNQQQNGTNQVSTDRIIRSTHILIVGLLHCLLQAHLQQIL